jgi:hypothetical protein
MMWFVGLLALTVLTSVALIDARKQKKSEMYIVVAVERIKE